ncbi:MAG: CPBP family intramembrane metalloprotease [Clostridia bacterium]|nr:CPBP family intramembrane metalloprotease [Clostridia bacterium]
MENKTIPPIVNRAGLPRPTIFAASGFVLLAAIGLWAANLAAVFLPAEPQTRLLTLINLIYYLPFVLIPVIAYMIRKRGLSEAVRLNPMPVFPIFSVALLAVISTFFCGILTALWSGLLGLIGVSPDVGTIVPTTSRELMLSVVIAAAIPAVCEELLFRGFVLSAWESRGTKYAVIVSSVLFALMHGNIYGLPSYIFVGLISGYLVFSTDSVYVGMVYHTVYNTACLVINYLTFQEPIAEEAAAAAAGMDTLSMVVSMGLELILGGFMIVMTLLTLKMRRRIMGIEPFPRSRLSLNNPERAMLILSIIPMAAMIFLA